MNIEQEELVHNARMSYGNMKNMGDYIETLGGQLVTIEVALQCLMAAIQDSVSAPKMQQIINLADEYSSAYTGRLTTEEMREKLIAAGCPNLDAVLVDAEYGNEAIDDGIDVYALKDGKAILLERHNEATKYEENGYFIALSPFGYETKFLNDLKMATAEEINSKGNIEEERGGERKDKKRGRG